MLPFPPVPSGSDAGRTIQDSEYDPRPAEKPEGVPEENWLGIDRGDEDLGVNRRIHVPAPERMKAWTPLMAGVVK